MKKQENGGSTVSAHEHSNWCLPLLIFSIDSKCFIEFFRNHHMTTFFCCRLSLFPPTQKCCLRKSLILVEMDLWGDRSNDSPSLLQMLTALCFPRCFFCFQTVWNTFANLTDSNKCRRILVSFATVWFSLTWDWFHFLPEWCLVYPANFVVLFRPCLEAKRLSESSSSSSSKMLMFSSIILGSNKA